MGTIRYYRATPGAQHFMLPTTVRQKSFFKQESVGIRGERATRTWHDGYNFFDLPGDEFHGTASAFSNLDATPSVPRCGVPKCPIDVGVDVECIAVDSTLLVLSTRCGTRGDLVEVLVDGLATRCGTRGDLVEVLVDGLATRCGTRGDLVEVLVDGLATRCGTRGDLVEVLVDGLATRSGTRGDLVVPPEEIGSETGAQGGVDELAELLEIGSETGTQGGTTEVLSVGSETGTQGGLGDVELEEIGSETGTQGGTIQFDGIGLGTQGGLEEVFPVEMGSETGTQGGVDTP